MTDKTGGPAFPTENEHQTGHTTYHYAGMTLRDYFAAKALQGILANKVMGDAALHKTVDEWFSDLASASYDFADAMLKVRENNDEA